MYGMIELICMYDMIVLRSLSNHWGVLAACAFFMSANFSTYAMCACLHTALNLGSVHSERSWQAATTLQWLARFIDSVWRWFLSHNVRACGWSYNIQAARLSSQDDSCPWKIIKENVIKDCKYVPATTVPSHHALSHWIIRTRYGHHHCHHSEAAVLFPGMMALCIYVQPHRHSPQYTMPLQRLSASEVLRSLIAQSYHPGCKYLLTGYQSQKYTLVSSAPSFAWSSYVVSAGTSYEGFVICVSITRNACSHYGMWCLHVGNRSQVLGRKEFRAGTCARNVYVWYRRSECMLCHWALKSDPTACKSLRGSHSMSPARLSTKLSTSSAILAPQLHGVSLSICVVVVITQGTA